MQYAIIIGRSTQLIIVHVASEGASSDHVRAVRGVPVPHVITCCLLELSTALDLRFS